MKLHRHGDGVVEPICEESGADILVMEVGTNFPVVVSFVYQEMADVVKEGSEHGGVPGTFLNRASSALCCVLNLRHDLAVLLVATLFEQPDQCIGNLCGLRKFSPYRHRGHQITCFRTQAARISIA